MRSYIINVGSAGPLVDMVENMIQGASVALGRAHVFLCARWGGNVMFRSDNSLFVRSLGVELSNYNLEVTPADLEVVNE